MQDIFEALDELISPKPAEPKETNYCRWYPNAYCDICATAEKVISEQAAALIFKRVSYLTKIRRKEHKHICEDCLRRFVVIKVSVKGTNDEGKRVNIVHRYDFTVERLNRVLQLNDEKPGMMNIQLLPKRREITKEFKARYKTDLRKIAMNDYVNRIYEGYNRLKKPEAKPKPLKEYVTTKDVLMIIKGEAKPRLPLSCKDCTKAVCPTTCTRRTFLEQLMIFKQTKVVQVNEYNLADYEDFP